MASTQKVRIAARLRPRIEGEIDDESIQVHRSEDGGMSCMTVPNPRDPTQVFKFPYVFEMWLSLLLVRLHMPLDFQVAMVKIQRRKRFSKTMSNH